MGSETLDMMYVNNVTMTVIHTRCVVVRVAGGEQVLALTLYLSCTSFATCGGLIYRF